MLELLVVRWGYLAVVLGTFVEGEAILVAAGAMAHRGLISLPWVMLCAFVGSVSGDQLWFQLGHRYGQPFLDKRPAWKARAGAVERYSARFGSFFVLGFRFIVGVRTVTPALLGASGYPRVRFAWLNALGGALWSVAIASAGYALGAAITQLLARAAHAEELLGVALIVALVAATAWRGVQRRLHPET